MYDAGTKPGTADLRTGRLSVGTSAAGRFAGWEDVDLPATVRWRVEGTDASERIYFEGITGVHVNARGGDDTIYGTIGADTIDAGSGEDTLTTYGGFDVCRHAEHTRGCDRQERATRAAPAASCHGRRATLTGTPGKDVLVGSSGDDVIVGFGGADEINGGAGDDVICAGPDGLQRGTSPGGVVYFVAVGDTVRGGAGDDLVDLGYDRRQVTQPGFAADRLRLDGKAGTTLRLAATGALGTADGNGHDRVVGQPVLEVLGSPGPDHIWGSPYADDIDGRDGDDVVHGLRGRDTLVDSGADDDRDRLVGGPGRDVLNSGSGPDVLDGGPADDWLVGSGTGLSVRGGGGDDQVTYGGAGTGCLEVAGGDGRDNLSLRPTYDAPDTLRVDLDGGAIGPCGSIEEMESLLLDYGFGDESKAPHWIVRGTPRADRVTLFVGSRLTAHLRGGDDTLVGGDQDDVLDGGPGDDTADGGGGSDACPRVEHARSCES